MSLRYNREKTRGGKILELTEKELDHMLREDCEKLLQILWAQGGLRAKQDLRRYLLEAVQDAEILAKVKKRVGFDK